MRPVCQYRQHLFNCVHVVFHRSCAAASGKNEPLLEVVFDLEGWMTDHHLLVMLHCLVRFLYWLLLYTCYMI
jgi:hypothetical protein